MTNVRAKEMLEMRMSGATYQEIANAFGISKQCAHQTISNYCQVLSGIRGRGFDARNIKYEGLRSYFLENHNETLTSFTEKIFGANTGYKVSTMRNFLTGKHATRFSIEQIRRICEVVGEPFEEAFKCEVEE